jgi:hypothetical protein
MPDPHLNVDVVVDPNRRPEAEYLGQPQRAGTRKQSPYDRRHVPGSEHPVDNATSDTDGRCVLIVNMNRIVISGHLDKSSDVVCPDDSIN